jgi:ABC-type polysaccharide/polyol phosphate transport system ATPase subunit
MTAPLLHAEGLGKLYTQRGERSLILGRLAGKKPSRAWALRNANLEVYPGEVVAAIGRNGAGKSTLLKIASGVTTPTEGKLTRPDNIAPLIEVGAGFHPDLSGRENVEINARLLGMTAGQIRRRFDQIVAFSDLAHAIDQPVRQYSSGMYMRLGFAVAVHTSPDLLVVDEVLAVGDLPFQIKCLDRIRELKDQGVGVLFVSHNLTAVLTLADRALLLDKGETVAEGAVTEVVGAYHRLLGELVATGLGEDAGATNELVLTDLTMGDEHGAEPSLWNPGDRATFSMRILAKADLHEGAIIGIRINKEGAGVVAQWNTTGDGPLLPAMSAGDERDIRLHVDLNLGEGRYNAEVAIARHDWSAIVVRSTPPLTFGIAARQGHSGMIYLGPSLEHHSP